MRLDDLRKAPNALAQNYTRFRVADRLLLTGHSHQAWPDVALEGQLEAFEDAARDVDAKWDRAFAKASEVAAGFGRLLGAEDSPIALGANTHELVVRFLSSLDLRRRPRLVTTDGEFHTLRRQLTRLAEEGLEVVRVAALPADTLAERLAKEVDDRTSAVLASLVLFETAHVVRGFDALAQRCQRHGAELLVDAYHALGVIEMNVGALGLQDAWIVGGGYKYLQLGEGNCFLRLPAHAERMRPAITGWFAEYGDLADAPRDGRVAYAVGAARFAGATYDPVSHYRAARVMGFFGEHGLTPSFLRAVSLHQVGLLAQRFDALALPTQRVSRDRNFAPEARAGFLALRCEDAQAVMHALAQRGVHTDSRGAYLRFGPAPYLSDAQLESAVDALGEVCRA